MNIHEHELQKREFQIERIALFSDAVFAIAITLLIIEIKVPELEPNVHNTDKELLAKLLELIPRFVGFIVSFLVIGLYWLVHHRMFNHVINYNRKLLVTNLFFLLSIVMMPFSSGFYSDYYGSSLHLPILFYACNICFSGFMNYRLWKVIANKAYHLSDGLNNKVIMQYNTLRALSIPAVFIAIYLLSYLSISLSNFLVLLIPLVTRLINWYYQKKHPEAMKQYKNQYQ